MLIRPDTIRTGAGVSMVRTLVYNFNDRLIMDERTRIITDASMILTERFEAHL